MSDKMRQPFACYEAVMKAKHSNATQQQQNVGQQLVWPNASGEKETEIERNKTEKNPTV